MMMACDQIVNEAAKYRYICGGGSFKVPMVVHCASHGGIEMGGGPQQAQSIESRFIGSPGVRVVTPSTPADAKGLMKSAIRDDNVVIFFQHRMLNSTLGSVPEGDHTVPFGQAVLRRTGKDISLVAYALMAHRALEAAKTLEKEGIDAEVLDLRSLVPYDKEAILATIRKTGRLVLIEEGPRTGGVGAELAAFVAEEGFYSLKAPIHRLSAPDSVLPGSRYGAKLFIPQEEDIVHAAREICRT